MQYANATYNGKRVNIDSMSDCECNWRRRQTGSLHVAIGANANRKSDGLTEMKTPGYLYL